MKQPAMLGLGRSESPFPAAIASALMVFFSAKTTRMSLTKLRATAGGTSNCLRGIRL